MSSDSQNPTDPPGRELAVPASRAGEVVRTVAPIAGSSTGKASASQLATSQPSRQLLEMPRDELEHLAEDLGMDPTRYVTRQLLVAAVHDRRQMIVNLDREAMLDIIRWGRRPIAMNAAKEAIAVEIARISSMRFAGLSDRGLWALAKLRGVEITGAESVPDLVRKLKKQEGIFAKINRKRRSMLGSMVAKMVGDKKDADDYKFLPPPEAAEKKAAAEPNERATLKQDIEEGGLFGGISNRIKRTADTYLNQKLDEIEARIDRKLDEIDRRLTEWRDKEIANRIRILKITLWASVIVGICSLLYAYIVQYLVPHGS